MPEEILNIQDFLENKPHFFVCYETMYLLLKKENNNKLFFSAYKYKINSVIKRSSYSEMC